MAHPCNLVKSQTLYNPTKHMKIGLIFLKHFYPYFHLSTSPFTEYCISRFLADFSCWLVPATGVCLTLLSVIEITVTVTAGWRANRFRYLIFPHVTTICVTSHHYKVMQTQSRLENHLWSDSSTKYQNYNQRNIAAANFLCFQMVIQYNCL